MIIHNNKKYIGILVFLNQVSNNILTREQIQNKREYSIKINIYCINNNKKK